MNWKQKAFIQNCIAVMPDRLAQPTYYNIQKKFGDLASNIAPRYRNAIKLGDWANQYHSGLKDKKVLEVGTGRSIDIPLACWLMGASEIISVDLNRYLRPELVKRSVDYLLNNSDSMVKKFSAVTNKADVTEKLLQLQAVNEKLINTDLSSLFKTINLTYLSPADATSLNLKSGSIDYHISLNVFEHIPEPVLLDILKEGRRLLSDKGAMIHFIDPSDHFAHTDSSISEINFLKFSALEWRLIGGNRFMYHNRMRATEYRTMFQSIGLTTLYEEEKVDQNSLEAIRKGLSVHSQFRLYKDRENAVSQLHTILA